MMTNDGLFTQTWFIVLVYICVNQCNALPSYVGKEKTKGSYCIFFLQATRVKD